MSSLEDVFLDVVKSAEAQEEKNVTVTLCTGETVLVKQGGPSVVTPSGVEISIQWELDADGHLVYASSKPATNSTTAQMMVTVPEGVSGGGQVSVGGVLVTVPEGLSAGQTFIADIPAAGPHSVSVHGPGDAGTVPMQLPGAAQLQSGTLSLLSLPSDHSLATPSAGLPSAEADEVRAGTRSTGAVITDILGTVLPILWNILLLGGCLALWIYPSVQIVLAQDKHRYRGWDKIQCPVVAQTCPTEASECTREQVSMKEGRQTF